MTYNSLYKDFKNLFPDDKNFFIHMEREYSIDDSDGTHISFGSIVVPFVIELIESENHGKAQVAFDFFEEMAKSDENLICEVVDFTILEEFVSRGKKFIDKCKKYMGAETLSCYNSVSNYLICD